MRTERAALRCSLRFSDAKETGISRWIGSASCCICVLCKIYGGSSLNSRSSFVLIRDPVCWCLCPTSLGKTFQGIIFMLNFPPEFLANSSTLLLQCFFKSLRDFSPHDCHVNDVSALSLIAGLLLHMNGMMAWDD